MVLVSRRCQVRRCSQHECAQYCRHDLRVTCTIHLVLAATVTANGLVICVVYSALVSRQRLAYLSSLVLECPTNKRFCWPMVVHSLLSYWYWNGKYITSRRVTGAAYFLTVAASAGTETIWRVLPSWTYLRETSSYTRREPWSIWQQLCFVKQSCTYLLVRDTVCQSEVPGQL